MEGAYPKGGGCQPIIWPDFAENCMKMKKIGPRVGGGGRFRQILLFRSANEMYVFANVCSKVFEIRGLFDQQNRLFLFVAHEILPGTVKIYSIWRPLHLNPFRPVWKPFRSTTDELLILKNIFLH